MMWVTYRNFFDYRVTNIDSSSRTCSHDLHICERTFDRNDLDAENSAASNLPQAIDNFENVINAVWNKQTKIILRK